MPLPSSGQIDLNAMHVEAGGTTGTEATINDSDIRGLISKAGGAQMAFNEWYGASALVTIAAQSSGTSTSTTVTLPSFSAGDIAVATIAAVAESYSSGTSITVNTPSGWTQAAGSQSDRTGPFTKGSIYVYTGLKVCYKVLTAGDTTFTNSSSGASSLLAYRTTVQIYRPSTSSPTVTLNDASTASSNTINASAASSSVIMFAATAGNSSTHTWGSGPTYNNQLSRANTNRDTRYVRGSSHFQSTATPSNVSWSSTTSSDNRYVSGYLEVT